MKITKTLLVLALAVLLVNTNALAAEPSLFTIVNDILYSKTTPQIKPIADVSALNALRKSDSADNFWEKTDEDAQVIMEVRYAGYLQNLGYVPEGSDDIISNYMPIIDRNVSLSDPNYGVIIPGTNEITKLINSSGDFAFVEKFTPGNGYIGFRSSNDINMAYKISDGSTKNIESVKDKDHFQAYDVSRFITIANQAWIIAFEDKDNVSGSPFYGSDWDYNDLVCLVYDVQPTFAEEIIVDAQPDSGKVILAWTAISEKDVLGYNIYRSQGFTGKFEKINDDIIMGKGSIEITVDYEYVDDSVNNGIFYQYKIEEVASSEGLSLFHGPVNALPSIIYSIF